MMYHPVLKRSSRLAFTLVLLVMLTASVVLGQGETTRFLTPGEAQVGVLNEDTLAQVYAIRATTGGTAALQINADEGLILSVVVNDPFGVTLAQTTDAVNSGVINLNVDLPAAGTYYATVFPAAGTDTVLTGSFTIEVSGSAVQTADTTATTTDAGTGTDPGTATDAGTPTVGATDRPFSTGQVLLNGITVNLEWATTSDLNLQVRDPQGRTLFFNATSTDNGGTFGFDVNGLCEVLTPAGETAVETAEWGAGAVATGSYEILVFYRRDCETVGPVPFTVNVTVDGQALDPIQATLPAPVGDNAAVYLASFYVGADGTAALGPQGPYTDTRVLPEPVETYLTATSAPLIADTPVTGLITSASYYDTYTFTGTANELVSISMTAQDGNLDTLLLVLDQTGRIVADNDDIVAADDTNSAITNLRLTQDGTYTVIATRYGKNVSGTEGNYQILLTGAADETPQEVAALNLPDGDIEVTVTWNTNADVQLLVRDPAGDSVFDDKRTVSSGGQLVSTGNINCTVSATTPPAYYIYWPVGRLRGGSYEVEVWYQDDCGDTSPVTATLYISVGGVLLTQTDIAMIAGDRYVTSFVIDTSGNPVLNEGGIIGGLDTLDFSTEQPQFILYGSQVNGIISPSNKFDVYTFTGAAGDIVSINMARVNGSLDTLLYLVGPDGFQIAENDDIDAGGANRDSLIREQSLPVDGTYTIVATHFGTIFGGTTGGYTLTLTRSTPAPAPTATGTTNQG